MTLQPSLAHRASENPHGVAFREGSVTLTWRELYETALVRAAVLRSLPLGRDRFVAIGMRPSLAFAQWLHASILAGASVLLLNPDSPAETLAEVRERFPVVGWLGPDAWRSVFAAPQLSINDVERPHVDSIAPSSQFSAAMLTSGTTGRPKVARLGWTQFAAHAEASRAHLALQPEDTWLACMPVHHVGGLSIFTRAAVLGCKVVIQSSFDPAAVWNALLSESITHLSLVPTQFKRLLDIKPDTPFPLHVRCVLLGGAAVPGALADRARALRIPLAPTYGLTEACSQVATLLPERFLAGGRSCGAPLDGVQVRIVSSDGLPCADGIEGEIAVRGPTVFDGYLDEPLGTDGWFATGDHGMFRDGELFVFDRRSDLIISGGENVYPTRVEDVLRRHPSVRDCAVVGIPDKEWGQRVTAVIDCEPGTLDVPALVELCRRVLSRHEVPKEFMEMRPLLRTANGKLRREAIRTSVLQQLDME